MQISADQCRAARGLLSWTQDQLATNAVVSRATVVDFESNGRYPMKNNLRSISDCIYAAGIELIPQVGELGVGVRFRHPKLEYVKGVRIDHHHSRATMRMRYSGEDFLCHISLEALDDYHDAAFQTDKDFSKAVSDILHIILAAAERHAQTHIQDGAMVLTHDLLVG